MVSGQAGLVVHRDDSCIYMRPVKARVLYWRPRGRCSIVWANARCYGKKPQDARAAPLAG